MTVSSSTNRVSYSGNGTLTTFAYTFKVFDESDLTVIIRASNGTETTQTITTDYTVTGVGDVGGGNVVFTTAPASTETVVILREQGLTQGLDLVANDPFPAQSLEEALDKLTFMVQQHDEELGRAIKASKTNTLTGSEFTISASDRANKVFSFDSSGDVNITQAIGTFRGDWAASTSYVVRDIVKDTNNNNIYIANTAHTSSGSVPLSSNADIAKWDLLVDAASATTSATNAAASETAAQTAQTAAETAQAAAETAETNAETAQTAAETAKTGAETAKTAAETAQTAAETALDSFDDRYLGAKSTDPTVDNDGDALIDGALYFDTTNNVLKVYDLGNTAWNRTTPTSSDQTKINTVSGISANVTTVAGVSADVTTVAGVSSNVTTVAGISANVTTVAGVSGDVTTVAGIDSDVTSVSGVSADVTTVAGISANVTTVAGLSSDVTTVAGVSGDVTSVAGISSDVSSVGAVSANVTTVANNLTDVNNFANRYQISASTPSSPTEGMLWYDSTNDVMKVYNGNAFQNAGSSINGTSSRNVYTATAAQTDFSATYDIGFVDVYLNGIKLKETDDFTATDGTTVTLTSGAAAGDIVDIVGYGTFELADAYTKADADARYLQTASLTASVAELNYNDITTLGLTEASKVVTADANGVVSFDNGTIDESTTITSSSGTLTLNLRDGNFFEHDLTEDITTFTVSNAAASGRASCFVLKIIQGSTARTIDFGSSVKWAGGTAPTITTTDNGVDVFIFFTIDGGTNIYGFTAGQALA